MRNHAGWRWELLLDAVALIVVVAEVYRELVGGVSIQLLLVIVAAGLVAIRRRFPLASAAGLVALSAVALLAPDVALVIWILASSCLFSLPLRRSRTVTLLVAIPQAAVLYAGALVVLDLTPTNALSLLLPLWTLAAVGPAFAVRAQSERMAEVQANARATAAAREAQVLQRVEEERLRIARDLHDSVANSIAVMTINAANALRKMHRDEEGAREDLQQIRRSGATVLGEMTEILTVLRRDSSEVVLGGDRTIPTASSIPALIESMRSAGLAVDASVTLPSSLDPAVDAALFRVAQESLTNAQRHGTGSAVLSLAVEGSTLVLRVSNALGSGPFRAASGGFGLVGMRERVESAGGQFEIGETVSRFSVEARFIVAKPANDSVVIQ